MAYEVQTTVFEGPFDLLLHLILNEQVDLYEVSLSRIVDAYLPNSSAWKAWTSRSPPSSCS
jgi:chromatin segregation and condensation protein Rec8/ScpA/Scc1 (kleisin family)